MSRKLCQAATFPVTVLTDTASNGLAGTGAGTAGDLRYQIIAANTAGGTNTINFSCGSPPCTLTLGGPFPPITSNLTIDGGTYGNIIIDGANSYRVFFVDTGTVALSNLQIQNAMGLGGSGSGVYAGGGGGAELGGGLFVNQSPAEVTLTNVPFSNCSAQGGAGGGVTSGYAGGSGGGLAFSGGTTVSSILGGPGEGVFRA